MRTDTEIKTKIVELLELSGDDRTKFVEQLDKLDITALQVKCAESHSVRGMLSGLYWVLGYSFQDIREQLVERCLLPTGEEKQG